MNLQPSGGLTCPAQSVISERGTSVPRGCLWAIRRYALIATSTWLLTSTTYGTWLPGDSRGFVGRVNDTRQEDDATKPRLEHDQPGSEYDRGLEGLRRKSQELMKGQPVLLNKEQAVVVRDQFLETARFRHWDIGAIAVMANHFHLIVTASESTLTDTLLRDLKSYASRALNLKWSKPLSGRWWTTSASRRRLPDEVAIDNAIQYVMAQQQPLALFPEPERGTSVPRASTQVIVSTGD